MTSPLGKHSSDSANSSLRLFISQRKKRMAESQMETDEELVAQSFSLFQDKALPSPVEKGEWHPDKDLLAMICEDGKVVLHRLNWDKLWAVSPVEKPTSICWRPDGKVLAIGHNDGSITLHDAENGKMLRKNKLHNSAIVSLSWVEESQMDLNQTCDYFSYDDRTSRFFPPPPKAPFRPDTSVGSSGHNEEQDDTEQELINSDRGRLNILCSGDKDSIIYFNVFGLFPIGTINVRELPISASTNVGTSYAVMNTSLRKVALSKDLSKLIVLTYGRLETDDKDLKYGLYTLMIDTSVFQERNKELYQVALQASNIEELQDVLIASLKAMHKQWSDSMATFREKFRLLSNLLLDHGSNLSARDELVNVLCGVPPSTGLRQFLENTLNEMGLKRLSKCIDSAGKEMYDIIGENLQPAAELLAFRVGELKGLCELGSRVNSVGLDGSLIDQTMEDVGMLVVQIERLLRVLSETLYQFQNFFAWLSKTLKRLNNESPSQSDQVVIHSELVMVFLLTIFDQDLISSHLDGACQDVQVNINEEATRRLEELAMLGGFKDTRFLQRTLFQQLRQFLQSYKEAFSMPFKAVSGKFLFEDIMLLSHVPFLHRNAQYEEPISVSYYERINGDSFPSETIRNTSQDYICFRTSNDTSNHSSVAIVRGFTRPQKHVGASSTENRIEVLTISFDDRFQCTDFALYKEDQLVVLLNGKNSNDTMSGHSLLTLLPLSDLPFVTLDSVPVYRPLFELCNEKSNNIHISIRDGSARRISQSVVAPLLVSESRGLACVLTSQRHALVFILEEEEEPEEG